MRQLIELNDELGCPPIEHLKLNPQCRDEVPKLLFGLKALYCDQVRRRQLFELLDAHLLTEVDRHNGRPGLSLWELVVIGIIKQGTGCDYDRLHDQVNSHTKIRTLLGRSPHLEHEYSRQQLIDNVDVELLAELNALVVAAAQAELAPTVELEGHCDSFVVETDVEYPLDTQLLFEAGRRLIKLMKVAKDRYEVTGWRQYKQLRKGLADRHTTVRQALRGRPSAEGRESVKEFLARSAAIIARVADTLTTLAARPDATSLCDEVRHFKDLAERLLDQVDRRVLRGETIPHAEKIFSVHEPHTRWCAKGKAGRAVELGVPVGLVIDRQHGLILHHAVMWHGEDVDWAVPLIDQTKRRYPPFHGCSFDRGFHSPANRRQLDARLRNNALPAKGRRTAEVRARESAPAFQAARRHHPAVESAINSLEHHGLDRVRTHGAAGFARTVALSVLSYNIHRFGQLLREQERLKPAA